MRNPEMGPREAEENNEFTEALSPERMEISSELFQSLMTSDKFLEALKISSDEEQKTGRETGFELKVLKDRTPYIYGVLNGNEESINVAGYGPLTTVKKIDGEEREAESKAALMSLHFHPKVEGPIIPSLNDLYTLYNNFHPPIMSICQTRKDGKIDSLLIRNKQREQNHDIDSGAENFREKLEKNRHELDSKNIDASQKKVQDLLEQNGFESFFISFSKKNEGLELDKKSEKIISNIKEDAPILRF